MAKILIIDDRPINRQFLTTLLGYQNHQLSEASDGAEALRVARQFQPDLIISDVLMPTMDGYEFVRRLREDGKIRNTPVIFSTAHYLSRESQALAEKCGVTSILYKPSDPQVVLEIVGNALAGTVAAPMVEPPQPEEFEREHQRLLTNKLAEKTEQLRDAHGKLTALIELSTELATERDPAELLDRYCSVARKVIGASWTLVVLLDPAQKTVSHLGLIGIDLEDTPALRAALVETGIFKTLIHEARTICLSDVTSNPATLRLPQLFPRPSSLLVAPLTRRGRVDGWICLADKLGFESFSEQDEQLAMALAGKMAVAYENARLYAESVKNAARLEREISERVKIGKQLSDSRARLAGVIDSAIDAIVTIDGQQRVILFNTAAEKMFRCSALEAMGKAIGHFIPERFRRDHAAHIRSFGATGVSTRVMAGARAVYGLRSDGTEFPLEASISQIEVAGEKLYTVIMRDITERKHAEEALKESENRLRAILEAEPECVKLLAADGSLVDMNPAGLAMLEADSLEQVKGHNVCELALPEHRAAFMAANERVFAGETATLEFEISGIKGTRRWLEMHATPLRDKDDAIIAALGITRDVTARRRVAEELHASERRFRELLEEVELIAVLLDVEGRVTFCNDFLLRLTGYEYEEVVGTQWFERFVPKQRADVRETFLKALRSGTVSKHFENPIRTRSGELRTIAWNNTVLRDLEGNVIGTASIGEDITDRRRAEEALRESEEQFRTMANSIPQLAWMAHADGYIFWYNQRWHDYTGKTLAEMKGWGWQSVHDPEFLPKVMERWQDAIATGQPFEMEFPLLGADGKFRMFLTRVQPVKDSQGRVVRWFGTNTDVDELKRVEEALRETQERLESAVAAGSVGTWVWDLVSNRALADEYLSKLFSINTESNAEGGALEKFFEAIVEEDRTRVQQAIERTIQFDEKYDIEFCVLAADNKRRWLHGRGRIDRDAAGNALRFLGMLMDITERKQAEEALRTSEARYHTLFEYAPDGIVISDSKGYFLDANMRMCEMLGYSRDELLGLHASDVVSEKEIPRIAPALQMLNEGSDYHREWQIRRKDGSVFEAEAIATAVPDGNMGVIRDITERKEAERVLRSKNEELAGMTQQLWQASKLATMGELAASIAHELNNPLATVGLRTENLLLQIPPEEAEKRKPLEIIGQEVDRMAKLVNNLLLFSRRSKRQVSTVDACEEIANSTDFIQYHLRSRNIHVAMDFADGLPTLQADRQQLRQLFLNLLTNASDAMPQGGTITITAASNGSGETVAIDFADSGEGISAENLAKIWEPFFTTKPEGKGTGLGLAICRRIVEEHGGTMDIQSESGKGTTVHLVFPATSVQGLG